MVCPGRATVVRDWDASGVTSRTWDGRICVCYSKKIKNNIINQKMNHFKIIYII